MHARGGDVQLAERLAREAVEIVDATDYLDQRGEARLALAMVVRATGRMDEATAEAGRALELFERKGNIVSAERARELLADLEVA